MGYKKQTDKGEIFMSYSNFKKALEEAKSLRAYRHGKGVNREIIEKAEQALGVKFSKQIYEYLHEYGYIQLYGFELQGIFDENFTERGIVSDTLERRNHEYLPPLPPKWVQILDTCSDGGCVYLDFEHINNEGEPRVILGGYGVENEYYEIQEEGEDFGDYLLKEVRLEREEEIDSVMEWEIANECIKRAKKNVLLKKEFNPFIMWKLKNGENVIIECNNKKIDEINPILIEICKNEIDKLQIIAITKKEKYNEQREAIDVHVEHEEGIAIDVKLQYGMKRGIYGIYGRYREMVKTKKYISDESECLFWKNKQRRTL